MLGSLTLTILHPERTKSIKNYVAHAVKTVTCTGTETCITHEAFDESDLLFDNETATCKQLEVKDKMTEHLMFVEPNCTVTSNVSKMDEFDVIDF